MQAGQMSDRKLTRHEIDGRTERQRVYDLLGSVDRRGLAAARLAARLVETLGIAGVHDAASLHAAYVAYARATADLPGWPETNIAFTVADADRVMRHEFVFYGESHHLPPTIDFEHNPGTDHWGHDLNRFTYLFPLVSACRQTGDRRYGREALALILHWIATTDVADAFPPGRSAYAWGSYLNLALHLENWSRCIASLVRLDPGLVTPDELLTIAGSVHEQLQYLDLVIPEWTNNWVSIGARGMLATFGAWPAMRCQRDLAARAYARLAANVRDTLLPDGAQKELSPTYHQLVLENVRIALQVAPRLQVEPPPALVAMYRRMLLYIRHFCTPDGRLAAFNDSEPEEAAWVIAGLAEPLARAVLGAAADEELRSIAFPYAGVMIMRQGSARGRDELYLAFDGGPYGMNHQHEDKLGLVLSAYGRALLVDPGLGIYDNSPDSFRHLVLRTDAHSTVCIDGEGQHSIARPELWCPGTPQPIDWRVEPDGTVFASACYDLGYGPAAIPVVHRRSIVFHPDPGWWEVTDTFTGDGDHRIDSHVQFAPGSVTIGDGVAHTEFPDANLALFFAPADWQERRVYCGSDSPRLGWYSPRYNAIEPAPQLVLSVRAKLPIVRRYTLLPYRGQTPPTHAPFSTKP